MVKKFASKRTKKLLTEKEIKEKGLNKSDFTGLWYGRVHMLKPEKSHISEKAGMQEEGEYAIKIR